MGGVRSPRARGVTRVGLILWAVVLAAGVAPRATAQDDSPEHAVGTTTRAFVDDSRPTAANGACAEIRSRSLPTTIYYPIVGSSGAPPQPDAVPDTDGGPYPLIVFAHGFSATADTYAALLERLAAAGYVVAAPTFPLSSGTSPCGPVAGDSVNQPEDLSVVIDSVLDEAKGDEGALAGLVDPDHIGAAGHSNGGITMYGLAANTEVRDDRVDAVVVMAGTAQKFPDGRYDFKKAPPLLLVHGTHDAQVPYDGAISGFNRARGPKGLLTVEGGDHGSAASSEVYGATIDFFDGYLQDDAAALARLPDDEMPGATTMKWVGKRGSTTTVPTLPHEKLDLKASVTPRKNLEGGQVVTVKWSGYSAGKAINILQCNAGNRDLANSAACDYSQGGLLHENPTGEGSLELAVIEGPVGDGVCDAEHPGCFILVNNASSTDPKDSRFLTIAFAR